MSQKPQVKRRSSVKKEWYLLYALVLIIPLLAMLLAYRYSYSLLADAVYEGQMSHLTLVRDLMDSDVQNMSSVMMGFGLNAQVREVIGVSDPAADKQMATFNSLRTAVNYASSNDALVDHYALYFPESEYLQDVYVVPRRTIEWKGYDGAIKAEQLETILQNAETARLKVLMNSGGSLILRTYFLYRRGHHVHAV